jgi:hypothetical protein
MVTENGALHTSKERHSEPVLVEFCDFRLHKEPSLESVFVDQDRVGGLDKLLEIRGAFDQLRGCIRLCNHGLA